MRWFKHLSASHEDEFLSELLDNFGAEGYGAWWLIIEQIASQMDASDRCFCRYSEKKWQRICRLSPKKFQKTLTFLKKSESVLIEKSENYLTITIPNLLKYRDEYSSRKKKCPDNVPTSIGRVSGRETETETETETEHKHICSELENSSSELMDDDKDPVVISLLLNDKSLYNIRRSQIKHWTDLYQNVMVYTELQKMKGWLEANPMKRKTRRGILRFITNWLARQQDKG